MKYNPDLHHRRSIRLSNHDYRGPGTYYLTICNQGCERLFGEIVDGRMVLNDAGKMVESIWLELPSRYDGIELDAFVIMPNHVHGIVVLVGAGPSARPEPPFRHPTGQPRGVAPTPNLSIPDVVNRFKSLTTARYREGVYHNDWCPFLGRLWQRNYYEHVIRDETELAHIRQYILENPLHWQDDPENVQAPLWE